VELDIDAVRTPRDDRRAAAAADPGALVAARRRIHRQALANTVVGLHAEAARTAGRLAIRPFGTDVILLAYHDVRTLVRRDDAFALETRDFDVVVAFPAGWPFDRAATIQPVVMRPRDFVAPNSNGVHFCIDLQGILPETIPSLIYDNLRLRRYRLDHTVDPRAAAFVRANLGLFPADPRPLHPSGAAA
jgi:hypothetical protein